VATHELGGGGRSNPANFAAAWNLRAARLKGINFSYSPYRSPPHICNPTNEHAVGSLLSGLTVPWWITGGWAIDLAVGHVTRDHSDVNVMMLERDEHALRGPAQPGCTTES
jgi:Aminoglycoside-2''-adenylyltransferase